MQKKWMLFTIALGLLGTTLGVSAQDSKERKAAIEVFVSQQGPGALPPPPPSPDDEMGGDNFIFIATEMSFGGPVVKGAPYSAQSVTESVQALADGNRIVHKTTAQIYRDSEGRTRRDQALGSIGPYAAAGDPPQTFFINDPVSGFSYILDPRSKVARKMPRMEIKMRSADKLKTLELNKLRTDEGEAGGPESPASPAPPVRERKEVETRSFIFTTPAPPPGAAEGSLPPGAADGPVEFHFSGRESKAETKTEKLEPRSFDGVQAEGERYTTTIAVGEIGNEQPIQIVNERWYSPELQVVVMTRHSDPRFGETTYRLTNITRSEPAATLFQVPPDYTLKDRTAAPLAPGAPGVRRMRRPAPPPEN
jgi:hypothetical protein